MTIHSTTIPFLSLECKYEFLTTYHSAIQILFHFLFCILILFYLNFVCSDPFFYHHSPAYRLLSLPVYHLFHSGIQYFVTTISFLPTIHPPTWSLMIAMPTFMFLLFILYHTFTIRGCSIYHYRSSLFVTISTIHDVPTSYRCSTFILAYDFIFCSFRHHSIYYCVTFHTIYSIPFRFYVSSDFVYKLHFRSFYHSCTYSHLLPFVHFHSYHLHHSCSFIWFFTFSFGNSLLHFVDAIPPTDFSFLRIHLILIHSCSVIITFPHHFSTTILLGFILFIHYLHSTIILHSPTVHLLLVFFSLYLTFCGKLHFLPLHSDRLPFDAISH